jgi:integrase
MTCLFIVAAIVVLALGRFPLIGARRLAARAGAGRRFPPHQLRHVHALELARECIAFNIIQRQLGHANLGTTSIYLAPAAPGRPAV